MAHCENCKVDKKHRNSTYFQLLKSEEDRTLPDHAGRTAHSWKLLKAFYYCHECIRNHWYVRKEIMKELNRDKMDSKIRGEIPEMRGNSEDEKADGKTAC